MRLADSSRVGSPKSNDDDDDDAKLVVARLRIISSADDEQQQPLLQESGNSCQSKQRHRRRFVAAAEIDKVVAVVMTTMRTKHHNMLPSIIMTNTRQQRPRSTTRPATMTPPQEQSRNLTECCGDDDSNRLFWPGQNNRKRRRRRNGPGASGTYSRGGASGTSSILRMLMLCLLFGWFLISPSLILQLHCGATTAAAATSPFIVSTSDIITSLSSSRSWYRRRRKSAAAAALVVASTTAAARNQQRTRWLFHRLRAGGGGSRVGSGTPTAGSSGTNDTTHNEDDDDDDPEWKILQQWARDIRTNLIRRLHYVQSGRRIRDVVEWQRTHQVDDIDFSLPSSPFDYYHSSKTMPSSSNCFSSNLLLSIRLGFFHNNGPDRRDDRRRRANSNNPFPPDRSNLGLHATRAAPAPIPPPTTIQLWMRSVQLILHFLPLLLTLPLAMVSESFRQNIWYKYLAAKIGTAGPTFIKWGQWSSVRTDLFPEAFCTPLEALQSDAPAHATQVSERLLLEAFELQSRKYQKKNSHSQNGNGGGGGNGKNNKKDHARRARLLSLIFDSFEPEPIASGSIAQVHRAVLDGIPIAIKLRHPDVSRKLDWDARIMQAAAVLMERTAAPSFLRLKETIAQFCHTLAAQTNLMCEASHLEQLNANFRRWRHVKFPTPIFASEAVIVETFEPGQQSTKVIEYYLNKGETEEEGNGHDSTRAWYHSRGELPVELAEFMVTTGVSIYMKMLIVDNLMHADLHPGNILVDAPYHRDLRTMGQLDANDDGHKSATLVDAGMVARLSAQESAAFIGIIASLGEGNGKDAADCILQFSAANANRLTEAQHSAFQDDVIVLFARECRGYGTNVDVGNVLKGLLTLIRKHEIMVDANFATLVINLLCIEGLAQKAWPQYNPLDAAQPILTAYRRLTGTDGRRKPLFHLRMAFNQIRKQMRDKMFFEQEKRKRMLIDELRGVVVRPPRLTV